MRLIIEPGRPQVRSPSPRVATMSEEEVMVAWVAGFAAIASYAALGRDTLWLPAHLASKATRNFVYLGFVASFAMLAVVLATLSSFDVRNSDTYFRFYMLIGIAWVGVFRMLPLGVSLRDDILERDNLPAAVAWAGSCVGIMACYAGANVGDGPSFLCVFHAGGLAILGFWFTAVLVNSTSRLPEHVTIDRDLASGLRLGGFFVASGVLWGRGAAGDFESYTQTLVEMRSAWPVLLLVTKVVVVEWVARPTPERPTGDPLLQGVLPVLADVLLVLLGLELAGPLPAGYAAPSLP